MTTPALIIPCASEVSHHRWRFIHPVLCRTDWPTFLSNARSLVRAFEIRTAFIEGAFGHSYGLYEDGSFVPGSRRQSFAAYEECNIRPGVPPAVLDTDSFQTELDGMAADGCQVIPYLGPWQGSRPPTEAQIRRALEPYGRHAATWVEDGAGARGRTLTPDAMIEPMAQRVGYNGAAIPDEFRSRPSFTLSQTYGDIDEDNFHPLSEYTGTRYWLDNERSHTDPDFWARYEWAVGAGFKVVLPPIPEVWADHLIRYGGVAEGSGNDA